MQVIVKPESLRNLDRNVYASFFLKQFSIQNNKNHKFQNRNDNSWYKLGILQNHIQSFWTIRIIKSIWEILSYHFINKLN